MSRVPLPELPGRVPDSQSERRLSAIRREAAHAGVARFQLHARDTVRHGAGAGAPVPLQMHSEKAQLAELAAELARQRPFFKPFGDVGHHAIAYERSDGVAYNPLFVCIETGDVQKVDGIDSDGFHVLPVYEAHVRIAFAP